MLEINNKIVKRIEDDVKEYLEEKPIGDGVEILLQYSRKNEDAIEHDVVHYFKSATGSLIGSISGMFTFDFYNLREIKNYWFLKDLVY